ncbi:hypothetical protein AAE478_002705 [Parahypoxylon ruwenzoriense]
MGLLNNPASGGSEATINDTMPLDRINHRRAWKSSYMLPFLINVAIGRLNSSESYVHEDGDYYRVLVNSAPQPIPACTDGPGTACSRAGFEQYLQERVAMFQGTSERCGANYDNSTDNVVIYTYPGVGNGTAVGKRYEAFRSEAEF